MTLHIINGVKIHTTHEYPPIPVRDMDWSAVTDDYEAESDSEGSWSTHPVGRGATEQEAINDLLDQLEDETNDGALEPFPSQSWHGG